MFMSFPNGWVEGDGDDWFAAKAADPESSNKGLVVAKWWEV